MVLVRYHEKYVGFGRQRHNNLRKLESRLRKLGWTNLRWVPENPLKDSNYVWHLAGCPPGYNGFYEDYCETAVRTLTNSEKPWKNLDKILVRKVLDKPLYGFKGDNFE